MLTELRSLPRIIHGVFCRRVVKKLERKHRVTDHDSLNEREYSFHRESFQHLSPRYGSEGAFSDMGQSTCHRRTRFWNLFRSHNLMSKALVSG
jgi:hypothetical protein